MPGFKLESRCQNPKLLECWLAFLVWTSVPKNLSQRIGLSQAAVLSLGGGITRPKDMTSLLHTHRPQLDTKWTQTSHALAVAQGTMQQCPQRLASQVVNNKTRPEKVLGCSQEDKWTKGSWWSEENVQRQKNTGCSGNRAQFHVARGASQGEQAETRHRACSHWGVWAAPQHGSQLHPGEQAVTARRKLDLGRREQGRSPGKRGQEPTTYSWLQTKFH